MSLKKETPSDHQLHLAALQGNVELLRKVLDSGKVHVDCKDKESTTPLIIAAANNHLECVKELLKQGADPAARRLTGTCALFFAAQGGFLEIVRELISHGAPVDMPSYDGGTPLFVACQSAHQAVAETLLQHGADLHVQMVVDGASLVFVCAQNGHLQLLRFLLSKGAKTNLRRKDGASALWIACQMGHAGCVKELLEASAEVDTAREAYYFADGTLIEKPRRNFTGTSLVDEGLGDGATPLFKAAHKGHADVVTELLKYKPNLGLLQNGESALHAAALFGHAKVIKALVDAGANKELKNRDNQTPAELARESGYHHIANFLDGTGTL